MYRKLAIIKKLENAFFSSSSKHTHLTLKKSALLRRQIGMYDVE